MRSILAGRRWAKHLDGADRLAVRVHDHKGRQPLICHRALALAFLLSSTQTSAKDLEKKAASPTAQRADARSTCMVCSKHAQCALTASGD